MDTSGDQTPVVSRSVLRVDLAKPASPELLPVELDLL